MADTQRKGAADAGRPEDSGAPDVTKRETVTEDEQRVTGLAAKRKARDDAREDKPGAKPEDKPGAKPEGTDADAAAAAGEQRAGGGRWSRSTAALVVPALIGVIGIVAAIVMYQRPGIDYDNQAYVDQEATAEVATATAGAVQRLMAIDYRAVDQYHDTIGEIATENLVTELDRSWETLKETYVQGETVVQVTVTDTAVTFLQDDHAEVLVSTQATVYRGDQPVSDSGGPVLVGMHKVDGTWKLSKIPDLPS